MTEKTKHKKSGASRNNGSNIIQLGEVRKRKIDQKRRNVERVLFRNLLGVYSSVDDSDGLVGVQLIDISRDGLSFQIPWHPGLALHYEIGEFINLRLYFGQDSYLPCAVEIRHTQEVLEAAQIFMRYGGQIDKSFRSYEALESFIEFIYRYAEHSKAEDGKIKILS